MPKQQQNQGSNNKQTAILKAAYDSSDSAELETILNEPLPIRIACQNNVIWGEVGAGKTSRRVFATPQQQEVSSHDKTE